MPSSQTTSDIQQECSSEEFEQLFYCTPPSPVKQLPMLSSCAAYTPSSQNDYPVSLFNSSIDCYLSHPPSRSSSLPVFTYSSSSSPPHLTILSGNLISYDNDRNVFLTDESFTLNCNSQNEIKQENEHFLIEFIPTEQNHDVIVSPKTISNTSSPSKCRVLNTPERLDQVKVLSFLQKFTVFYFQAISNPSCRARLFQVSLLVFLA